MIWGLECGDGGTCPNCGDNEIVIVSYLTSGPFKSPPGNPGKTIAWLDQAAGVPAGWYYTETRTYPCPICQSPNMMAAKLQYLWEQSGLEPEEREWRLDFLDNRAGKTEAVAQARGFLATCPTPAGLVSVSGDYGRGKTGILKCLVAAFIRAGVSAMYRRGADILAEIRETYGADELSEATVLAHYGRTLVLAVDEVDRIPDSAWAKSTMMTILDARYSRRTSRATIIATNARDLGRDWQYLSSRLQEGMRIEIGGIDLRRGETIALPEYLHET